MDSILISTENLTKIFGKNAVINELNLEVPEGISGFIGRNGAGKTTTIGILLGLLKPNKGKATVFGLDSWQDSYKIRSKLGVMHETNAYPGSFTGKRFLEYIAQIYGISNPDGQINVLLKDVGLWDAKEKPIKTYSAGMTRRLGLAQALIGNPKLAILDEPTANIDPIGRTTLLNIIKDINKEQGTSFLISTHILSDLEKVCKWLAIIDAGKIVDQGNVNDLAEKYSANTYKIAVSNPALLLEKINSAGLAEKAWIEGETVYCTIKDQAVFYNEIPKIAASLKLQLKSFQNTQGTIEEIYAKTAGGN